MDSGGRYGGTGGPAPCGAVSRAHGRRLRRAHPSHVTGVRVPDPVARRSPLPYSRRVRGHPGGARALETHVITKYANRKLYNTLSRRYVSLEVIAELLREGHEVRVVDRTTGRDITAVTLSQILLDLERQRRGPLPEPLLVDAVRERGDQGHA